MNLILVCMMFLVGMIGSFLEIFKKKSYLIIQWLFILLFVLCILSRIGHSAVYSDFSVYLRTFVTGNNLYFESGYLKYCDVIKRILGDNEKVFVVVNASFIMIIICNAIRVLNVGIDGEEVNKFGIKEYIFSRKSVNYISSVLFAFTAYWGIVFAGEGIRQGIGITIAILAIALIMVDKIFLGLILLIISIQFHNSMYIVFPIILIMLLIKRYPSKKFFMGWFILLIIFDIIINMTPLLNVDFLNNILNKYSNLAPISRFFIYSNTQAEMNYFSTQYIFYHILAILILRLDFKNKFVCKSVFLYYIGLSLGTIFSKTIIVMRIEWVFLPMIFFSSYFFLRENKQISDKNKFVVLSGYSLLQIIMVLRYLGMYV